MITINAGLARTDGKRTVGKNVQGIRVSTTWYTSKTHKKVIDKLKELYPEWYVTGYVLIKKR